MYSEEAIKKKYRLSLLYLLKDLLISIVVGGIIGSIIMYIIFFVMIKIRSVTYLELLPAYFTLGAVIGIVYRGFAYSGIESNTGVSLYNTYAGIHNTFLFASAGGDYSYGAAASVIGIFITLLRFIYKLGSTIVVVPMSLVYLCIMAILETIFRGIPEGLGNFLDKIIPITAKLCGVAAVIIAIYLMNQ